MTYPNKCSLLDCYQGVFYYGFEMIKEKATAVASKYLFVTSLIMLFGLLRSDGMHRGFPLYWIIGRHGGHVQSAEFLLSFILVLAVVIAADLIAKLIMRTREPELKIIKGCGRLYEQAGFGEHGG